jgi:hypothetical protein
MGRGRMKKILAQPISDVPCPMSAVFFRKEIVARQKIKSYLDASQRMASLLPA